MSPLLPEIHSNIDIISLAGELGVEMKDTNQLRPLGQDDSEHVDRER
jgi:hypothetical protein